MYFNGDAGKFIFFFKIVEITFLPYFLMACIIIHCCLIAVNLFVKRVPENNHCVYTLAGYNFFF
jgi:hypothetical protein